MNTIQDILADHSSFKIPRLDLELLIADILDCCRTKLYSHPETTLNKTKIKTLKSLAKKRSKGIPLAYLTNHKEFYGLDFYVDERVLIPRPETELIVEKALQVKPETLLDIGTGSGTIALSVAKNLPNCKVTALDISKDALDVAEMNAERFDLDIKLVESNLLQNIPDNSHFDLLTANLPYIGELKHRHIAKETEQNEPNLALFAGEDGLDLYRRLLQELKTKKISFKYLVAEFGFGQHDEVVKILSKHFQNYQIQDDLAGIPRIFIVTN